IKPQFPRKLEASGGKLAALLSRPEAALLHRFDERGRTGHDAIRVILFADSRCFQEFTAFIVCPDRLAVLEGFRNEMHRFALGLQGFDAVLAARYIDCIEEN